jgi:SsrA-binding protein
MTTIKNKKANYEYFLLEEFISGIVLVGTEIKSIRAGKVSLVDSFCSFIGNELFLYNTHIDEYKFGNQFNHEPKRPRKLLLTKRELKKLKTKIQEKGLTIVPVTMFINDKGFCKLSIYTAKGKKNFDKKYTIREKEEKIRIKRDFNINI